MSEETTIPTVRFSAETDQLFTALTAAQLNYNPIVKDKFNPHTKSYYADLQAIVESTRPALAAEGLVIIQLPLVRGRQAGSVSRLTHKSGQFAESELLLPTAMPGKDDKFDAQSIGSAITYSKRYNYTGLTGAVAEDDDDGNAAASDPKVEKPKQVKAPPAPPKEAVKPTTIAQAKPQTNDPAPVESSVVPKAVIPAAESAPTLIESTSSQTEQPVQGEKPTKTQFDAYTNRAILLKGPLEKAGLKASGTTTTGAKIKSYLLAFTGTKELAEITIAQWEDFFSQTEQGIAAGAADKIVAKIEGGNK